MKKLLRTPQRDMDTRRLFAASLRELAYRLEDESVVIESMSADERLGMSAMRSRRSGRIVHKPDGRYQMTCDIRLAYAPELDEIEREQEWETVAVYPM